MCNACSNTETSLWTALLASSLTLWKWLSTQQQLLDASSLQTAPASLSLPREHATCTFSSHASASELFAARESSDGTKAGKLADLSLILLGFFSVCVVPMLSRHC